MIPEALTDNELRTTFARWLKLARKERKMPPIGIGLSGDVTHALRDVARQGPRASDELVDHAKLELERQIAHRHAKGLDA